MNNTDLIASLEAKIARLSASESGFHRKLANIAKRELVSLQNEQRRAQRAERREGARDIADRFVSLIQKHGGPKRLNVWSKDGKGTRVYFPANLGYVSISGDGSITEINRGRYTLCTGDLYPAWRRAYRAALADMA